MKRKFLLGIFIILAVVLIFTGCQKITQEDVDKQWNRWWVLTYKLYEIELDKKLDSGTAGNIITEAQKVAGEKYKVMIGSKSDLKQNPDKESYDKASLNKQYCYISEENKLLEEAIINFGGKEALKEIEGKYTLEEVYGSLEKANEAVGVQQDK